MRLCFEYQKKKDGIRSYLEERGIGFKWENGMEEIMEEKWMCVFMVGYEAWLDLLGRGLGVENEVVENGNGCGGGEVGCGFQYGEEEEGVNRGNYEEGIKGEGGEDNINRKVWWEK